MNWGQVGWKEAMGIESSYAYLSLSLLLDYWLLLLYFSCKHNYLQLGARQFCPTKPTRWSPPGAVIVEMVLQVIAWHHGCALRAGYQVILTRLQMGLEKSKWQNSEQETNNVNGSLNTTSKTDSSRLVIYFMVKLFTHVSKFIYSS